MEKHWSHKIVVRNDPGGGFFRMHPGGFGVRFKSGPYVSVDLASVAPMNLYQAQQWCKLLAVHEYLGSDKWAYCFPYRFES